MEQFFIANGVKEEEEVRRRAIFLSVVGSDVFSLLEDLIAPATQHAETEDCPARRLRCYRCHAVGHVRAACRAGWSPRVYHLDDDGLEAFRDGGGPGPWTENHGSGVMDTRQSSGAAAAGECRAAAEESGPAYLEGTVSGDVSGGEPGEEVRPLMDRLCDELKGLKEAVITLTEQHSPPAAGPHTRPQSSAELQDAVLADARGMLDEELRQLRRELQELSLEVAQMKNQKQLEVDQMKNQKQLEAQAAPQLQQLPIPQLFSCDGKAPATTASTIFGSGFSKTTPSTGTVSSTDGGLRFGQAPSAWTGGTTTGASAAASTGFSFGPTTAPPAQPSTPSFSFRPPTAEGATSTPAKARGENTTEEGPVSSTSGSDAAVSSTTTSSVVTSAPAAGAGAATPNSSFHFKAAPFWFAFGGDQSKVGEATPKATFEFGVSSAASSPFKFSLGGDADKSGSSIFGGAAAADTKTTSIFGGSSVFGGWPSFGSAVSKPASSESGAAAKPPTPAKPSAPKAPEPASSGSAPSAPPAAATGSTGAGAAATPAPSAPPAAATGSIGAGAAATPAPTNG
ncbi:hypothetical protein FJT64_014025 [Amphibalanus amphitrite]|uniref:Uncharacterized protein n=1 Tax=Amphibalanus amphitrite TaxID=1232801 RepID=A0A6A4V8P9_AMPAM|nr:hypothetical protein FJT64_014025 [Amphibalanus amphitrite]